MTFEKVKVGIVGLSVHSAAFTEILNSDAEVFGCKVVALFHPKENADVAFSDKQIANFRNTALKYEVELVDSMKELLVRVDAVMVLTNDGRPHLAEVLPILEAGQKVFLDKPVADNWRNVRKIYEASAKYNVPVFSSSALRYGETIQSLLKSEKPGEILGANTFGPAPLQSSHVDLFWDGIHGIEMLYTVMGIGCRSVIQFSNEGYDLVVGKWEDGKIGIFRGIRTGKSGFGGTAFGRSEVVSLGAFSGYEKLVEEMALFFRSDYLPVPVEETLEIYAFMDAAYRSKKRGGKEVALLI